MVNVRSPIHMRRTNAGRLNKNPGSCVAPKLPAEAAEVEVLLAFEDELGPSGRLWCGTEAEAIPVGVIAPADPEELVVNVPAVEMVEVVNVVVLLGVVGSAIVPVDCRGGWTDTSK